MDTELAMGAVLVVISCIFGLIIGIWWGRTEGERQAQEDKSMLLDAAAEVLPKEHYMALLERCYDLKKMALTGKKDA